MEKRRLIIPILTIILILGTTGCKNAMTGEPSEEQVIESNIPLATLLYVGFGFHKETHKPIGGLGTRGWNVIQGDSLYEGLVISQPEIGWYASMDIETIKWQLEQMKRAGISVIFVSWQGWGDDDLDGSVDPSSIAVKYDATTRIILSYIKDNGLPFQFAVMLEDFPGNLGNLSLLTLTPQQRQTVMDHLWDNYYSPTTYGDIAFRWDGKPLIAGGANTPGQWWDVHDFKDSRFELREIYDKPEDEAEHWAAPYYTPPPSALPGPEGVAMIWPRHDGLLPLLAQNAPWVTLESMRQVDPLGTEGAYDKAWKEVIEYAPRSDIRLVWIWSWNSYAEITYLEPDSGLGPYAVGDLYVRKTAHYVDLFRSGRPFEPFSE